MHFDIEITQQDMEEVLRTPLAALDNKNWLDAFRDALLVAKKEPMTTRRN
jgi:hypothetical protein